MNTQTQKVGRGRPVKPLALPEMSRFTLNDVRAVNPHIVCRLSLYTKVKELVRTKVIRKTRDTQHTGGVGKPLRVFITATAYNRLQGAKRAAQTRKAKAQAVS
jgi:hypothetical protein